MLTLSKVQEILQIPKDGPHFGGHLLWVGIHPKVQRQFLHPLQTIQWTKLFSKVAQIHFHLIRAKFFHETPRSLLVRTAKKQWAIFLLQSHPREHLQSAFVRKMNKKYFVLFGSYYHQRLSLFLFFDRKLRFAHGPSNGFVVVLRKSEISSNVWEDEKK